MLLVPGARFLVKDKESTFLGQTHFVIKIQSYSQYLQYWILLTSVINYSSIATKRSDEKYDFMQMCGFHLQDITETLVF